MRNSAKTLEAACNILDEPFFILNADKDCIFYNRAFVNFLGFTSPLSLAATDFWPTVGSADLLTEYLTDKLRTSSGDLINVRLGLTAADDSTLIVRVLGSEDPKHSSYQNQRLETLGTLASGVAHDFNNVLAGILGHITYLKTVLPNTGPHLESLKAIEDGARKSALLTQQILNFSRSENCETPTVVDLADLTMRTCRLLKGAIPPQLSFKYDSAEKRLAVVALESQIAQIIVNLVVNSRDALAENGVIWLKLERLADQARLKKVFAGADLSSAAYALLTVRDNGHGIPPHILERIFEPYFSTKKEKGTGLGLSMVDSIVRSFGGAIEIRSSVGKGTEVSVYLPLAEEQADQVDSDENLQALVGGSEAILVVDDDYPVRNMLSVSLRHLGYNVQSASSGASALKLIQEDGHRFDLVILDMIMPDLSGADVYYELREFDKDLKVLLISGYSSERVVQKLLAGGARGFMQKPFTIEELATKVRSCLEK